MLKFLFATVLFTFSASFLGAQSADINGSFSNGKTVVTNSDKAFYADQENKTFFIDFENLNVNLSDIVVKDALGGVVFKDEVSGLPVDTIYELDMSRMKSGTYDIELRSYTGVIRKTVTMP
jgi:hypothetical protein